MNFGLPGEYLIIKDRFGKILSSGRVIGNKKNAGDKTFNHVSVDGLFYFNLESKDFVFEFKKDFVKTKQFDGSLDFTPWEDALDKPYQDIYKDKCFNIIDKEVSLLVKCLNKIHGLETFGSCSGHGVRNLYVDCVISDLNAIILLESVIMTYFIKDFDLLFVSDRFLFDGKVNLTLKSKNVGDLAYKAAENLSLKILESLS